MLLRTRTCTHHIKKLVIERAISRDEGLASLIGMSESARFMWLLKRGISFLRNLDGIVFFAGYPYSERQSDGYFQRVQLVDS